MARKKLTSNSEPVTVGLDIGYGVTKAVTGDASAVFPSVWMPAREVKFKADELAEKYPGEQLTDDDGSWFVGDLATRQGRQADLRNLRGHTADEKTIGHIYRVRLAKVALGKLLAGHAANGDAVHVRLATGLPVDHMASAALLKEALGGQHRIQTDQTDMVVNVTDVMVMPQPYGTIYRHMLTERGTLNPCHTYTRTGVLDVGRFSIDVALDDNGEYLDAFSGSSEAGMYLAQEVIEAAYQRARGTNERPRYQDVETILKAGCVRIGGQLVDFTHDREQAIEPVVQAALNLMSDKWGSGALPDVIYIAGGGGPVVAADIKAAYPQAELTDAAQLSNAQGYFNYARFAQDDQ